MTSTPVRLLACAAIIACLAIALGACGGEEEPPAIPLTPIPIENLPKPVERVVLRAIRDAGGDFDIDAFFLINDDSHLWLDPSLGCPQPGRTYAQAMTSGDIVQLLVNGNLREYRTDMDDHIIRCDS